MANASAAYGIELRDRAKRRGSADRLARFLLQGPAIVVLFLWAIVPLGMTIWFSFRRYNLLEPDQAGFAHLENYRYLLGDPSLGPAILNTFLLVGWVLIITVGLGTLLAVLYDQEFFGRSIARVLVVAPFFVMPTVSALVWKNMLLDPANGILAFLMRSAGLKPIDWFGVAPLTSIVVIVSWEWLPFAVLTLLTAVQSLDHERKEAARMDGAGPFAMFFYIIRPHLGRAIAAVIMIETIFLLTIFAEIFVTSGGGPGFSTTNLAYLIYRYALLETDIGAASVGGILAVLLANIVAIFLISSIAKNLDA